MRKRSLKACPICLEKAQNALDRKGWIQQDLVDKIGVSRQPVVNFFQGKSVDRKIFVAICEKLEIDCQEVDDSVQTFDITDKPRISEIFISRVDEIEEFQNALDYLLNPEVKKIIRQVILIRAEGGWGKTTLLAKYEQLCEELWDKSYQYIDWEKSGIDSQQGTPAMMNLIASRLEKNNGKFANFRQTQKQLQEISNSENNLDPRYQKALSTALVSDLIILADKSPVVLLFDNWEIVYQFADQWLTKGLFQCLNHPRFLFVIAGRLSKEVEIRYRDIIPQYTHERSLYFKDLDSFTPREVSDYFKQKIGKNITVEDSKDIYEITKGIPLAVKAVAEIVHDIKNIKLFIKEIKSDSQDKQNIIFLMTQRFLKYLDSSKEKKCIYSLVLMRRIYQKEDFYRRVEITREIWLKSQLINSSKEYDELIENLKKKYSFLFDGMNIHSDVYYFIRQYLSNNLNEVINLCEQALKICELNLQIIYREYREDVYKYELWQEWFLDLMNYKILLGQYEDVIREVIDKYFKGRLYGTKDFPDRLISILINEPIFYNRLSPNYRIFLDNLANKQWLSLPTVEAEMRNLLNSLDAKTRILTYSDLALNAAKRKDFISANNFIHQAQEGYNNFLYNIGQDIQIEKKIGSIYHHIGLLMSKSNHQDKCIGLELLKKAREWNIKNPYVWYDIADLLISLGRIEQANLELERAKYKFGEEIYKLRGHKLNSKIAKMKGNGYSPIKQSRILTTTANILSSKGEFKEAEILYRFALQNFDISHINNLSQIHLPINQNNSKNFSEKSFQYVRSAIKLSHLLCNLGGEKNITEAKKILARIQVDSIVDKSQQAAVCNAQAAVFLENDQFSDAIENYRKAIKISEDFQNVYINAYYGLGKAYLRQNDPEEALENFDKIWQIKKTIKKDRKASLFWILNYKGIAYLMIGDFEEASESFIFAKALCEEKIKKESRQYQTLSHLGLALLGLGEAEKAKKEFETFLKTYQIYEAKGLIKELLNNIEIIGQKVKAPGWESIYALLTSSLSQ